MEDDEEDGPPAGEVHHLFESLVKLRRQQGQQSTRMTPRSSSPATEMAGLCLPWPPRSLFQYHCAYLFYGWLEFQVSQKTNFLVEISMCTPAPAPAPKGLNI